MFTNFIYFLVALIVYTTCRYPEGVDRVPENALFYALLVAVAFVFLCRVTFKRILKKCLGKKRAKCDQELNSALTKLSVAAVFVFAADLYLFRLKLVFSGIPFFTIFPTFEAVIFLSVFLIYLVVVWDSAWQVQKTIFPKSISRKNFVISNISFALPALLPWFLISIVADIIRILPFQGLSNFLSTPLGEICYLLIFLIAIAVFGPVLIQKLWRCSPLEPGRVREQIKGACKRADLKFADILKWDLFGGTMITAGVMGLLGRFRYILVTPALTRLLNEDEIDSVILHEIGHVKKNHLIYYLLFFVGYIGCLYFLFDPMILMIYTAKPVHAVSSLLSVNHDTSVTIFFTVSLVLMFVIYFRYVFGLFMRNFEREADTYAFSLMKDADPLISTFLKIARFSGQSPDKPNWHHFSINQRISYLEKCQTDSSAVDFHRKKVQKMVVIYFSVMVILFAAGYSVNFGKGKAVFNNYLTEKILTRELTLSPGNVDLLVAIGDYYFHQKHYKNALQAWEKVLVGDSGNVHALNNLAWLYATCEDTALGNPERALNLARKAVEIERAPYVLDTYAEALFANNETEKAIEVSREAFSRSDPEKKAYYKKQLERFQQKAGGRSGNTTGTGTVQTAE